MVSTVRRCLSLLEWTLHQSNCNSLLLQVKHKSFEMNTGNLPAVIGYTTTSVSLLWMGVDNVHERCSQAALLLLAQPCSCLGCICVNTKGVSFEHSSPFCIHVKEQRCEAGSGRDGRYLKQRVLRRRSKADEGHLGLLAAHNTSDLT